MTTTATTNTLATLSLAAEKALFGQPDWSTTALNTATELVSIAPAVSNRINRVLRITAGYSAAPAAGLLTVKDGSTVIWQCEIGVVTPVTDFDFRMAPLRGSSGASVTVTAPSAGGTVIQTLSVIGDTVTAP